MAGHRWIPGIGKIKPGNDSLAAEELTKRVSELINQEDRSWEREKIQNCLDPECECQGAVQNIPLRINPSSDKLIWPKEKRGIYSVKTGYHVLKSCCPQRTTLSASSSHVIDQKY